MLGSTKEEGASETPVLGSNEPDARFGYAWLLTTCVRQSRAVLPVVFKLRGNPCCQHSRWGHVLEPRVSPPLRVSPPALLLRDLVAELAPKPAERLLQSRRIHQVQRYH